MNTIIPDNTRTRIDGLPILPRIAHRDWCDATDHDGLRRLVPSIGCSTPITEVMTSGGVAAGYVLDDQDGALILVNQFGRDVTLAPADVDALTAFLLGLAGIARTVGGAE